MKRECGKEESIPERGGGPERSRGGEGKRTREEQSEGETEMSIAEGEETLTGELYRVNCQCSH